MDVYNSAFVGNTAVRAISVTCERAMLVVPLCGSEEAGARERVANLQLAVMHSLQLAISCIVMRF